jgi:hypothetical protein
MRAHLAVVGFSGDTLVASSLEFSVRRIPRRSVDSAISRVGAGYPLDVQSELQAAARRAMPDVYPPVDRVLIGADGSIWLRLTTADDRHAWRVLGSGGEYQCTVQLARRLLVMEARLPRFWALDRDEDGLVSVVALSADDCLSNR